MKKILILKCVWILLLCLFWATPALAGSAQYTYDNMNRLVQVVYDNGTTIQYTYDAVGNRTVKQVTVPQVSGVLILCG
jgi:YD repeat-containing protein